MNFSRLHSLSVITISISSPPMKTSNRSAGGKKQKFKAKDVKDTYISTDFCTYLCSSLHSPYFWESPDLYHIFNSIIELILGFQALLNFNDI